MIGVSKTTSFRCTGRISSLTIFDYLSLFIYLRTFESGSGVYKVNINADEQKVVVTGSVNPSILVKKLVKSGKHAEIWNASSNQENKNSYQTQYLTDEPDASENQYTIPTSFGRENHHLAPEWFLNPNMGTNAADSKFDQNFAPPLSIENLQNRGNNHSGLGIHEWGWNLSGVSPISEYFHPPSLMSNTHGYYHGYQP